MGKAWGKAGFHREGECTSRYSAKRLNNGKLDNAQPRQPPKKPKPNLCCPECESKRLYRDGLRYLKDGESVQRWLCRSCGYRFSETSLNPGLQKPLQKISKRSLNRFANRSSRRQVCELLTEESKNLTMSGTRHEKPMREGTKLSKDLKGKLVEYAWYMKKNNFSETTIRVYSKALQLLAKHADLNDPESVKNALARLDKSESWKSTIAAAYTVYLEMHGGTWQQPVYKRIRKLPFIPTEHEIDQLIAGCGKKTATFLLLLKETAMRSGEACRLKWKDIDLERRLITLNEPEKGGTPRIFKISQRLADMLKALPANNNHVFPNQRSLRETFYFSRKRIAAKLKNPRLLRIHFHTLRHWKATMEYHKTKDLLHVKQLLGHRSVDMTTLYIQLDKALFTDKPDEFHVKIARSTEDVKTLLEVGFEYVCEKDGMLFFRKRK